MRGEQFLEIKTYKVCDIKTLEGCFPSALEAIKKEKYNVMINTMVSVVFSGLMKRKYPKTDFRFYVEFHAGSTEKEILVECMFNERKEYNKFKLVEGQIS